jgi:hypothetical protein
MCCETGPGYLLVAFYEFIWPLGISNLPRTRRVSLLFLWLISWCAHRILKLNESVEVIEVSFLWNFRNMFYISDCYLRQPVPLLEKLLIKMLFPMLNWSVLWIIKVYHYLFLCILLGMVHIWRSSIKIMRTFWSYIHIWVPNPCFMNPFLNC